MRVAQTHVGAFYGGGLQRVVEVEVPSEDAEVSVPQTLFWRSHPLVERGARTNSFLIGVMLLTGICIFAATDSIPWGLVSVLVLFLGLFDYFVPTEYRLDATGVRSKLWIFKRRKDWGQLRSFYSDRRGVLLSPFPKPSRLDTFRGIYLRCSTTKKDVQAFVRQRISAVPSRAAEGVPAQEASA